MICTRVAHTGALGAVAIATVCAGCAQVFGIDETSSNNVSIEIHLQRVSIGASVVVSPLEVGNTPPAFLVEDTSDASGVRRVPASLVEPGRWAAPLKTVEGMVYTPPDSAPRVVMFPKFSGAALTANYVVYEHPNPQPAPPPPADFSINVAIPPYQPPGPGGPGENFAFEVPGSWVYYTIPLPAAGATAITIPTLPASAFLRYPTFGGPPVKITTQDAVTLVRRVNGTLTGQLVTTPIDQSTGTTTITGALGAVTPATPFGAALSASAVATRFTAQVPAPSTAAVQEWRVEASPGYAYGAPVGISLANGTFTPTDTAINGVYGNPFPPQWHSTFSYTASASRTFSIGGAAATMDTRLQMIVEAKPGLTLDMPAGLPTMTAVNGVPLNSDGMTVALDVTKQVTVDIIADRTKNTLYEVTLVEIAVVGSQVTQTPVVTVSGLEPHLPLPPRSMQTGHTYNLRTRCVAGGYTNAAAGDLQATALPFSTGYQEGAVFTVIPATN